MNTLISYQKGLAAWRGEALFLCPKHYNQNVRVA
jgi:hypothetical protein